MELPPVGHFLLCGKVSGLSRPRFLAGDPVSFHMESVPRDAMLHQRALVTKSLMAIVGSCLTASSAVWPVMEECPPDPASFHPSVPPGKVFHIIITAWILEPHRPGGQRQRRNVRTVRVNKLPDKHLDTRGGRTS